MLFKVLPWLLFPIFALLFKVKVENYAQWVSQHKDVVWGGASGVITVFLDSISDFSKTTRSEVISYDIHVVFMALLLITIKVAYGSVIGVLVGRFVTWLTKKPKIDINIPDSQDTSI